MRFHRTALIYRSRQSFAAPSSIQLWLWFFFFVYPGSASVCGPGRSMCGGRQTVKTPALSGGLCVMWLRDPPLRHRWRWSLKSHQKTHLHGTNTRKWETDYWAHFRFYTSTKSDFTLLIDCLWFILMFGVRFLWKFSYFNVTSATKVNRLRHPWWGGICSVYLSMTEQLSHSFFFFLPIILFL